jgi:hypothetical protein
MLKAIPRQMSTSPTVVRDNLRDYMCGVLSGKGIIKNHSGFSTVIMVSSNPPIRNMEPITVRKYPTVSLCLDSSAFSCRYSLKNIRFTI